MNLVTNWFIFIGGRHRVTFCFFIQSLLLTGEPLSQDKNPRGLLLLCFWTDPTQDRPCALLCRDGSGHD